MLGRRSFASHPVRKEHQAGYRDALASSQFRVLLTARFVSMTGSNIAAVALTVLVYHRTNSPFLASLAFAVSFLPYVISGMGLSALVDRVRPRALVTGCDACAAILAAAMATPHIPIAIPLVLLFCVGLLSSLSSGAIVGLVRTTVAQDAYVPARSLVRLGSQVAQVGGNAVGGILLGVLSPSVMLLLNAASFLFSAAAARLALHDYPHTGGAHTSTLLRDSLQGAREVFSYPRFTRLALFSWLTVMLAVAPEAVAAPYVATHHVSSSWVGWYLAASPVGVILGNVVGMRLLPQRRQRRMVAPLAVAAFLPLLGFAWGPPMPIAMALVAVEGLLSMYMLGIDGRLRDAIPERLFARAMTLYQAGLVTLTGLGFTLSGAIAQGTGPGPAVAIEGGCGVIVVVTLLGRELQRSSGARSHHVSSNRSGR